MAPLRAAPLAAWTLLAALTAVQFMWASDRQDDGSADGSRDDRPAPVLASDHVSHEAQRSGVLTGGWATGAQRAGHPATRISSPTPDDPARWPDHLLPPEALVATVIGDGVASLSEPATGNPIYWFANPTEYGGQRTFLVVDDTSSPDYVKVSLPVMPNGQEGWLPRSAVSLATVTHRAEVDLSAATVTVWDGSVELVTTRAITGRPTTPTPLGRFYVRDIIAQPDPSGAYGPWILALSGFSETLTTFGGGLPALALHGTDEPERMGAALSSGCVRIPNEIITVLAETVPLGTPVTIVA